VTHRRRIRRAVDVIAVIVEISKGVSELESARLAGIDRNAVGTLVERPLVVDHDVAGEDNLYGAGVAEGVLWWG
jgi:hypothetical protein